MRATGGQTADLHEFLLTDVAFARQHDARRIDNGVITLFDKATIGKTAPSRGLRLAVDDDAKTVTLDNEYNHDNTNAYAMGNTQTPPTGPRSRSCREWAAG